MRSRRLKRRRSLPFRSKWTSAAARPRERQLVKQGQAERVRAKDDDKVNL